ncbi:GumC family protein [Maribacter sp. 4G9]|uniref:GumC family protein n=1 Tax=Maribacter sp. 4G9 TaxID=1889777 RepID=UPI000F4EA7D9|nr:hypothetical protein [Maribacter sp. 4G9]
MRHIGLLIGMPIILAAMVFYLTMDQPKTYNTKARVYTGIASGSTIELEDTKIDFRAANTAYDNLLNLIKARTTIEVVGLHLFAQHMALGESNPKIISAEKYESLLEEVPQQVKDLVVKGDVEKTLENFVAMKDSGHSNYIYKLINLDHPDYSIEKISAKIGLNRISNSDFVDIQYESDDAAICQNTLLILCEVFVKLNADIKVNQSDAVVKYFEGQLNNSTAHLKEAEDELLDFNRTHNIFNYNEQTKHIAAEKEEFEIKYFEIYRKFHASKAILDELESKLATHEKKRIASENIMELRKKLSLLNFEISMGSLGMKKDSTLATSDSNRITQKMKEVAEIEAKLATQVEDLYQTDYDNKSVASTNILATWLQNTIEYEGYNAQLQVMEQKRLEFEELYKKFSPLGATMKRLERKIDIAEREYLSLLHSLGLAKLKQQNVELKSNIKLTEVPYYPINPKPSKRMMLVAVAGIVGFLLVVIVIFLLEFLDSNINTAARAEDKIELSVSSIFPVINLEDKGIDYGFIQNKAVNAISRNVLLNQYKKSDMEKPVVNMLFSTQENEGKSFICKNLITKLCELDYKVLHITYDVQDLGIQSEYYQKIIYPVNDRLYKISEIHEFDSGDSIQDYSLFDFVVLEIPGIIKNPFPVKLASTMDYTFLVTRANRAWSEADKNALRLFNEATTGPEPTIILNGVKVLEMETVLGELPKKRSLFRKFMKQVVQFRFFNKRSIA